MLKWEKLIYKKQGFRGVLIYLSKAFLLGLIWPGTILWASFNRKGLIEWLTNGVIPKGMKFINE